MTNGRTKGATAERRLAKLFSAWWGSEFARTPLSGGFATVKFRDDWNASGDLVTPDKTFPFCVESKKVEGWTLEQMLTSDKTLIHKWWEQTVKETPAGKIPLLVFTKNHAPLYMMIGQQYIMPLWAHREPFPGKHGFFSTFMDGYGAVNIYPLDLLFWSDKNVWLKHD